MRQERDARTRPIAHLPLQVITPPCCRMKLRRYAAALRASLNGPGLVPSCGNSCPAFKVSRITGLTVRDSMRVRFHLLVGPLMQIRPQTWGALFSGLMLWNGCNFVAPAQASEGRHALAMHGEPALPEDFSHLPYVDPAAPKGGRLIQGVLGTFDSLNPFIVRGIAPQSIRGYVVESLMTRGYDEPFIANPRFVFAASNFGFHKKGPGNRPRHQG